MKKVDYKKELKDLYSGSVYKIKMIVVSNLKFLSIEGKGNPNTSQEYKDAVEALFSISYNLKFTIKKSDFMIDYGVMPLESMWWRDNGKIISEENKDEWLWKALIMQPDIITKELVETAIVSVKQKKKDLMALDKVKFESFDEGKCLQTLYVGSYTEEAQTIKGIHDYMLNNNLTPNGNHHEIYLNDPRRTAPEKLKTLIRQPIK